MSDDPKAIIRYPAVRDSGLDDWRWLLGILHARFRTGSFVKGLELANRIGEVAEEANHHPDLDLSYPTLDVRLVSHDVGGVTSRDLDLARQISEIAAELGVEAAPSETTALEIALDVPAAEDVRDFWAAVLGYEVRGDGRQVEDPGGRRTTLWFQDSESAVGGGAAALPLRRDRPDRGRRRSGSTPRSPPAARWSATTRRPRSGCWPTGTATRPASARPRAATSRPNAETAVPDPGTVRYRFSHAAPAPRTRMTRPSPDASPLVALTTEGLFHE